MNNVIDDIEFDVVIIGSGPAGIAAGLTCASYGVSCCVLESMRLPRYKSCVGGLTYKSQRLLESLGVKPLEDLKVAALSRLCIVSDKKEFTVELERHILAVDRGELDKELQSRYRLTGAYIEDCAEIARVDSENHKIFRRNKPAIRYTYLICADGASGELHKQLLTRTFDKVLGVEVGIPFEWFEGIEGFRGPDTFSLRLYKGSLGYQWIAPQGKTVNVGMAFKGVDDLEERLRQYIRQKLRLPRHLCDKVRSALIPCGNLQGSSVDAKHGIVSVGDAAGYADVISGEGIYFALSSGILAAKCICEGLEQHEHIEVVMQRLVGQDLEVCKQIAKSVRFAKVLYNNPQLLLGLCNILPSYCGEVIERHLVTGEGERVIWKTLMNAIH